MGQSFNELSTEQVSWRVAIAKYSPTFESASSKDARRKESFFFFKLLSCSFVDLAHGVSCQGIFALKPSKCFNTVFSSMLQTFLKFRMVSV